METIAVVFVTILCAFFIIILSSRLYFCYKKADEQEENPYSLV